MPVKTQIVWNRRAFRQVMKYWNDGFIKGQREEMNKLATIWADGFNKIVANWDDKPRFNTHVQYNKSTRRFFVRVQISGSKEALQHFEWVDVGLKRGQTVKATGETVADKVKIKGEVGEGGPRLMNQREFYLKSGDPSTRAYSAYVKEERKRNTEVTKRGRPLSSRKGWMPMRLYKAHTGKGGHIGGPGTYTPSSKTEGGADWKSIPYMESVVIGDIEARHYRSGLYSIMKNGRDVFGVGKIWPKARTFTSFVQSGYRKGVKYAKAAQG